MRIVIFLLIISSIWAQVDLGVDVFFRDGIEKEYSGKRIGLITNHTGVNSNLISTVDLFATSKECKLQAIFTPEHGLKGVSYAGENIKHDRWKQIPIYSLHGATRRPTAEMLKEIDVLVYDIQDIGVRSYTYATTLFYVMEEAAKQRLPVLVFDRPNPLSGEIVDGMMLDTAQRSFIGYINTPYCHGMTIGELADFFNTEYKIDCFLRVIPMKGWKRSMAFRDTGLKWVPTSPHIPEADSPFYYATTGILGELDVVNIGVGYTLPFKLIGAPWIDADLFAKTLNDQRLKGVRFLPFHYRPFYGSYQKKECHGVLIHITSAKEYKPMNVYYLLLGILKSLYPKQVGAALKKMHATKGELFSKAMGSDSLLSIVQKEQNITWKLIDFQKDQRADFLKKRQKHLIY